MTKIEVSEEALDSIKRMAAKTLEERDMLLNALKDVTERLSWLNSDNDGHIMESTDRAKEAIAKVEGNAGYHAAP